MPDASPVITELADRPGAVDPPSFAGADHPMRTVTRRVAFDGAWDARAGTGTWAVLRRS